jgi:hypothetical protein
MLIKHDDDDDDDNDDDSVKINNWKLFVLQRITFFLVMADEESLELDMEVEESFEVCMQDEEVVEGNVCVSEQPRPGPSSAPRTGPLFGTSQPHSCILCDVETNEHLQTLTVRGIPAFVADCRATMKDNIAEHVAAAEDTGHSVHSSCREVLRYKAKKAEKSVTESKPSAGIVTRSMTGSFSFKDQCFYCAETTDSCKSKDIRRVMMGKELDTAVRFMIAKRNNDDWAVQVLGRLQSIHDLFASDAVYHANCRARFAQGLPHTPHKIKRGRPVKEEEMYAFDKLCQKLEADGDNELHTLQELHQLMCQIGEVDESVYSKDYVRFLLKKRYGNHLYFASRTGRADVVGFSNFCELLIHNKYFSEKSEGDGTEAERLVKKAADLILADIREHDFEKEFYPNADYIQQNGSKFLPPLMKLFVERLIQTPLKQGALGQALVQAAKPRGCLMPLLFGAAVDVDKLGNRQLHDKLSRMGFSLSYDEVQRFKQSVLQRFPCYSDDETMQDTSKQFTQYVADNFDHNIKTLDGKGTFHGMGIISATVRPQGTTGIVSQRVRRIAKLLKADDAVQQKCAATLSFHGKGCIGLQEVKFNPMKSLLRPIVLPVVMNVSDLWHSAGMFSSSLRPRPNWSGCMQTVCEGTHPGPSAVEMLSLIDLKPSDDDCVYSTLVFISQQAQAHGVTTPCVTFDQPLFIKAVDIAKKANLSIVVRLGGFHTLMNFLGSIGHIMKGSGLEEVLGTIFGGNTLEHLLSGKAYARAVRGHFLVHSALISILLEFLKSPLQTDSEDDTAPPPLALDDTVRRDFAGCLSLDIAADLESLCDTTLESKIDVNDELLVSNSLKFAVQQVSKLKLLLSERRRTARLWILYMRSVDLVKTFLLAERTGNWHLHLDTVSRMLPLFAASGHRNYAKSARLYVQEMQELENAYPWLYMQFTAGLHSIRRSDRVWAGLSCDLVIEQTMMRAGKSTGGLTRGRGMHEAVRTTWLSTLTDCASIHAALSHVTGTDHSEREHEEVGVSRMKRDYDDWMHVRSYLSLHSPFRFADTDRLVNLASGMCSQSGDGINCDTAEKVGLKILSEWDDKLYGTVKVCKADKVKTMAELSSCVSVGSEKISLDPTSLFMRLVLVGERSENVRECFAYELTQYPMALFNGNFMRKPDKPSLYRDILSGCLNATLPLDVQYVVDGGYMLHKVRWHAPSDLCDILALYHNYLSKFGHGVTVVFDGYEEELSTKAHEHERRAGKAATVAPSQKLDFSTKQIGLQEPFLSNVSNKKGFIKLLAEYLTHRDVNVHQATGDADTLIVSAALDAAAKGSKPVAVLAEDTDILVLLLRHWHETMHDVFFWSEAKKGREQRQIDGKCINIAAAQHQMGSIACQCLPAVHAFGGCDTVSAIFGHGKGKILKSLSRTHQVQQQCLMLQSESATSDEVSRAGLKLMLAVYGGGENDTLAGLRYSRYCVMSLGHRFQTEKLPPSDDAARLHSKRAHLQAVLWEKLGTTNICVTDWGWKVINSKLIPTQLEGPVAPENLLSVVRCQCRKDCSSASCSCRKHGLQCVSACGRCHGMDCSNVNLDITDDGRRCESLSAELPSDIFQSGLLWDDEVDYLYEEEV